jgi:hypothetical protein
MVKEIYSVFKKYPSGQILQQSCDTKEALADFILAQQNLSDLRIQVYSANDPEATTEPSYYPEPGETQSEYGGCGIHKYHFTYAEDYCPECIREDYDVYDSLAPS